MYNKGRNTISKLKLISSSKKEINYENEIYRVWYTIDNHQLTISRKDNEKVESWYDLWNIKNQIFGDYVTAVEIYPSRNDLIDGQNQRHLFILDTKEKISFENVYRIINHKESLEQNKKTKYNTNIDSTNNISKPKKRTKKI